MARIVIRITPTLLAREFKGGLTVIGLARKYGLTRAQVEAKIRAVAKRKKLAL